MSDTVAVALITFASGLLGALTGAVSSYLISKNTAKNEHARLLHTERRESYSALLRTYHTFTSQVVSQVSLPVQTQEEVKNDFQIAYVSAALLASDETADAMTELMKSAVEIVRTKTYSKEDNDVFSQAITAMQREIQEGLH